MRLYASASVSAAAVLSGVIGILGAAGSGAADAARLPRLLSQTGLYPGPGTAVDPRNLIYSPQYPLWSDGAQKSRWIFVPPGSRIDATDVDGWEFPAGTRFWKQFAFAGRKVETRLLWKATPSGWTYATYLWNSDQSDAVLASPEGVPDYYEVAPGKRHSIPSVNDCKDCHESETKPVLGFTALQLSTDRDPLAPNAEPLQPGMVTLRTLVERGLLRPLSEELVREPPRIPSSNARTRAMLGYFAANCSQCHATGGSLGILKLSFAHRSTARVEADEPGLATTVGQASDWQIPNAPDGATRRIQPGSPDLSAVFYRMNSRQPSSQMPPLGTVLVDQEAVDLLRRWITEDLPKASLENKR
jgi:hypothetical protein